MSVTEVKEALGAWSIRLRANTPRELLDALGPANYFGHIALIPGRGFNVAAMGDGLLTSARYVGVYRARFNQDDEFEIKGAGMASWLGNEDDSGDVFENTVTVASAGFAAAIQAVLPPGGSITEGTLHVIGGSATYTGSFRWQTPRQAIARLCNVFTTDVNNPVEWRINGAGTLDAGLASQLYNTTAPSALIVRKEGGRDLALTGLEGSLSLDSDVEDYATRIVVFGEGEGAAAVTGAASGPATGFRDIHGNPVVLTKLLNEPDASAAAVGSVAAVALSEVTTHRSAAQLSTDEYDVKGTFAVGDSLLVYDQENGFFDTTRQATWQGRVINPIQLRCTELTWPVPAGWTVAFRDRNGGWWDLSEYYAPESGATSIVVGEFLQRLGGSGRDPLNGRNTPDSSIPDTPVFGTFQTATYLADSGATRSQIQVNWLRPLNTDSSVIIDGDHYEIRYRPEIINFRSITWAEMGLYPWPVGEGLNTYVGSSSKRPSKAGNPVELNTYEAQVSDRALFSYMDGELATAAASTAPIMNMYHEYNGLELPANWSANASFADGAAGLHSLSNHRWRSKLTLLAAHDAATIATLAAYIATVPNDGLQKYFVFEHEPEPEILAGTFTAATFREAFAVFAKTVIDNRGTKPIHPVMCLMGYTWDPASGRTPSDYNPAPNLLANGVALNQVVFSLDAYSAAPDNLSTGTASSKFNAGFVGAQSWGFSRFGISETGCKMYDANDRVAAPDWIKGLNTLIKTWSMEFCCWFSSDVGTNAGLEGWYWTYSASAQKEFATVAFDGRTTSGSAGSSSPLLTWQQPLTAPLTGLDYTTQVVGWDSNSFILNELTPGTRYEFQIRAVDNANPPNFSAWSASSFFRAGLDTNGPAQPAAAEIAGSRIAVQVTHRLGLNSGGTFNLDLDLDHLEVHAGGESFSPSEATLLGRMRANAGMIQARVPAVATFSVEATGPVYVRVVAVDKSGNKSSASVGASASSVLIDDAHISDLTVTKVTAGTITADWIVGARIGTAPTGARAEMGIDGFSAYNSSNVRTFHASETGSVELIGTLYSGVVGRQMVFNPTGATEPEVRFLADTGGDYARIASTTLDPDGQGPSTPDAWLNLQSSAGPAGRRAMVLLASDLSETFWAGRAVVAAGQAANGNLRGGQIDLLDSAIDANMFVSLNVWKNSGALGGRIWVRGDGGMTFNGTTEYFDSAANSTLFHVLLVGGSGTSTTVTYNNTLTTTPVPIYALKTNITCEHRLSAYSATAFTVAMTPSVNYDVMGIVVQ
jgi:hypothetical protein